MSDTYTIGYAGEAIEDLRDIAQYVEHVSGSVKAAQRQLKRIRDAVRSLETMPIRHPLVEGETLSRQGYRRMNVGNYAVFYVVEEEGHKVFVVRVAGGRRSPREVLGHR